MNPIRFILIPLILSVPSVHSVGQTAEPVTNSQWRREQSHLDSLSDIASLFHSLPPTRKRTTLKKVCEIGARSGTSESKASPDTA